MKKVFYYGLISLYLIFIIVFIINFFITDINKHIQTIYSVCTVILIFCLIIYLLVINFKSKIERKKTKENFFESPIFELKNKYTGLFKILLISSYVIFTIFILISLGVSFFESGSPRKIDGLYYLISHGDIIREISYQEYKTISIINNQSFNSFAILVVETALIATKTEKIDEI